MKALRVLVVCLLVGLLSGADVAGRQRITPPGMATYMAATATFTPAASATDIFTISGSASKTVRVLRVVLSGVATAASNITTITLVKRSAADTGGTAVASTRVPLDSTSAAASATVQHFTANPTVGGAVGTLATPRVLVPAAATATAAPPTILDWEFQKDNGWGTPVILRGTAEVLAVNMGGVVPAGSATFTVTIVWTEE